MYLLLQWCIASSRRDDNDIFYSRAAVTSDTADSGNYNRNCALDSLSSTCAHTVSSPGSSAFHNTERNWNPIRPTMTGPRLACYWLGCLKCNLKNQIQNDVRCFESRRYSSSTTNCDIHYSIYCVHKIAWPKYLNSLCVSHNWSSYYYLVKIIFHNTYEILILLNGIQSAYWINLYPYHYNSGM